MSDSIRIGERERRFPLGTEIGKRDVPERRTARDHDPIVARVTGTRRPLPDYARSYCTGGGALATLAEVDSRGRARGYVARGCEPEALGARLNEAVTLGLELGDDDGQGGDGL